jgi:hypothetical protein
LARIRDAGTAQWQARFCFSQELTRWVGTESGKAKPIHISDEQENLLADLKEGLAFVRKAKQPRNRAISSRIAASSV